MNQEPLFNSILIIEDDAAHSLLIKRAASRYASNITACDSVKSGLEAINQATPDLIITDLNLPDSKGVDHIQTLLNSSNSCPVLMLTSSTSISDAVRAMHLGAADFIVKNFDHNFDELFGLALSRVHNAQELMREKLKFQREIEALRVAIENGQDGMAVIKSSGEFLYQNSSFQSLIVRSGGEEGTLYDAIGSKIKGFEKLRGDIKEKLNQLAVGAAWSTEVAFIEDKDLAYDLHLSVIDLSNDGSKRLVVWIHDVSERKQRERFQKEILSTTTHDLKGPLAAISLCSEMLQDLVSTPDKACQLVTRINSSARGALGLIDEFLSARRIQEGTFVLQPSHQDVVKVVHGVVEEYRAVASARSINLSFDNNGSEKDAMVDGLALTRVIGNLVSNALKFTSSGGAVIVNTNVSDGSLTVSVTDTGTGMEPADVQRIFERYGRLGKHADIQGSGLGLYVVKNIVSAHGGTIEVTSQPGQGSTFNLTFPAEPPVNEKGQILCLDFA